MTWDVFFSRMTRSEKFNPGLENSNLKIFQHPEKS